MQERSSPAGGLKKLTSKSVKGTPLTFEGIDDVHGSDSLSLGMLCVGDSIPDDILEEYLEHSASLFVNEAGDPLHSSSTGKTSDGRFGDSLDVISQDLTVSLGATLTEALTTLSTSSHDAALMLLQVEI